MLADLTASQIAGWEAWMRIYHPFPDRHDPFFATLLSLTYNQFADRHDRKRPEDFLFYQRLDDKYHDDITAEEFAARLRSLIPRIGNQPRQD